MHGRRRAHRGRRYGLPLRYRVGVESADGDPRHEAARHANSHEKDRSRRHGTALQLDHSHTARERPPLHATRKCRCHHRLLDDNAHGQQRRQMAGHKGIRRVVMRFSRRGHRRAIPFGKRHQLQQPLDSVVAEELRTHIRRSRPLARHLYAPMLHRYHGIATRRHGRNHRRRRPQPRHA